MTNVVRAKFRVAARVENGASATAHLAAVTEGEGEGEGEDNAKWAHATPAGNITMVIGNAL